MIRFLQKGFSEADAMRSLWRELQRRSNGDPRRLPKIIESQTSLIPILRGNNVVIEKFVISKSLGQENFRLYLRVGAKCKLPENFLLPSRKEERTAFGNLRFAKIGGGNKDNNSQPQQKNNSEIGTFTRFVQKEFGNNKGDNNGGGNGIDLSIRYERQERKGHVVRYDKSQRQVVLEFDTIQNAIDCLDILPFGLDYNLYILGLR